CGRRPSPISSAAARTRELSLPLRIALARRQEDADAPHPLALLRARRERQRRRAAKQRDELATLHSITSSAVASKDDGMAMSSNRAVWWLMTSSNLLDCITGRSTGFPPLRMRPV